MGIHEPATLSNDFLTEARFPQPVREGCRFREVLGECAGACAPHGFPGDAPRARELAGCVRGAGWYGEFCAGGAPLPAGAQKRFLYMVSGRGISSTARPNPVEGAFHFGSGPLRCVCRNSMS